MKNLIVVFVLLILGISAGGQSLAYYLPDSVSYNPAIPRPKDVIFHEVGEWHVTHDRLLNYMYAVAASCPDRVKLETMGFSYENRPQILMIFTSPENHANLEQIRQQHVQLTDPSKSPFLDIDKMPVVVWMGYSIHGNESSGSNAAMLVAYYLAAAQGKHIDELLNNVIILLEPCLNPDGLQRFSTWANQHKSKNLVSDPGSREFHEVWPGGRFNHYWFDLNRDWLSAVHVESQNRLKWFHHWKPNIFTDHHEQASNATYFFQPGVPSRVNPLTPEKNKELTAKLATYHARFLDRIGTLYFTKEAYDDFYYGKGSTYPDINGGVGILFEQASSRGHLQETTNGLLSFPATIKNQFITSLSSLEGARELRKELLEFQRDFYKQAASRALSYPVKGYVFGDKNDPIRTFLFAEMLMRHQIQLHTLPAHWTDDTFDKNSAYMVSLNQPQHTLIRAIFDKTLNYKDSLFYDVTSWTMPLAFGLPYKEITTTGFAMGEKVQELKMPKQSIAGGRSQYAYLIQWEDFYAPAALNELLNDGILAKVATHTFEIPVEGSLKKFNYGTILIPVALQSDDSEKLFIKLRAITEKYQLRTYAVKSGYSTSGIDLGSSRFVTITKPSIAMITGQGVNPTDAGEVWHLLDQRMNIKATHLEPAIFNRINLNRYNTIIMVGGNYSEINKEKLKNWVQAGGTLILMEEAVSWAAQNGITDIKLKKPKPAFDSTSKFNYQDREYWEGSQQMRGAIFGAEMDRTHPLSYGYTANTVSLFKSNKVFMEKSKNPFATPFYYGAKPLQSGWASKENLEAISNSAAVVVNTLGNGRVINIADNPNFRAFWLGGTKLFMNSIFFGNIIDAATGRIDEF